MFFIILPCCACYSQSLSVSDSCNPMECRSPLSWNFSRQEYWSGLPVSSPGDLPDPVMGPVSLVSPASAGRFFTTALPGKLYLMLVGIKGSN